MAGYVGNIPVPQGTQTRQSFTATASQTSFPTIGYTAGFIDVYLNGIKLVSGTDFTASNGSDVVLTTGAAINDVLDVVIFDTFDTSSGNFNNSTFTSSTLKSNVTLKNDTEQDTDGGRASKIIYQGEQSGGEISTLAEIQASHDGTADDEKGDLIFRTNDGSDGSSPTEAMRIDSAQTAGFGVSPSPWRNNFGDKQIDIGAHTAIYSEAGNTSYLANNWYRSASNTLIYKNTAPASYVSLASDNIIFANAASGTAGNAITFSEKARINEHGLTFNGDTAAANALSDYETGSWNPSGSVTTNYAVYTKIGRLVYIMVDVSVGSLSGGNSFSLSKPFSAADTYSTGAFNYQTTSFSDATISIESGGIYFRSAQSGAYWTDGQASGNRLIFNGFFHST